MNVIIRPVEIKDLEALWQMMSALDAETNFMMYEPDERPQDLTDIKSAIHKATEGDNLLLIAEVDQKIVGYISAQRGSLRRVRHSAYIIVGIRRSFQHQGIGTLFFKQLDLWSRNNGVTRLELTVMSPNQAGKHLYEKNGFVVEGIRKNSLMVDGIYVDEFYMAKLFK